MPPKTPSMNPKRKISKVTPTVTTINGNRDRVLSRMIPFSIQRIM